VSLVSYQGEIVAVAGATRAHLLLEVEERHDDDPVVRFVLAMCLYAGRLKGAEPSVPYDDERAEYFARALLMDDDEFRHLDANRFDDQLLAGHFNVPIEQVEAKRQDLEEHS